MKRIETGIQLNPTLISSRATLNDVSNKVEVNNFHFWTTQTFEISVLEEIKFVWLVEIVFES